MKTIIIMCKSSILYLSARPYSALVLSEHGVSARSMPIVRMERRNSSTQHKMYGRQSMLVSSHPGSGYFLHSGLPVIMVSNSITGSTECRLMIDKYSINRGWRVACNAYFAFCCVSLLRTNLQNLNDHLSPIIRPEATGCVSFTAPLTLIILMTKCPQWIYGVSNDIIILD